MRIYENAAVETYLTVSMTVGDPTTGGTINVNDTTNWPSPGVGQVALAAIDYGNQSKVELITYTGKTATTLTGVTRAVDGTTAQSHTAGAIVRHTGSAKDLQHAANLGKILTIATKTAAYTAADADQVLLCDATSGAFSVTLPTAVGRAGKWFDIKKIDSSANAVTIDPAGSETVDGATTLAIATQHHSYTVVSDGANWRVI